MTDDTRETSSDYEVGYKKPPINRRYKKGQSGNSRGRPKASGHEMFNFQAILNEPVTVTQGGIAQTMPLKEAELRAILQKAVKKKTSIQSNTLSSNLRNMAPSPQKM